jgi:hypothetical protein
MQRRKRKRNAQMNMKYILFEEKFKKTPQNK